MMAGGSVASPTAVTAGLRKTKTPDEFVEARVKETGLRNSAHGADKFGFKDLSEIHWNLGAPQLYEHAIAAGEATIVQGGPICAETGVHTGRSPKDKHTVVDARDRELDVVGGQSQDHARASSSFSTRISSPTRAARSCSPRTSMAAPTRNTESRRGSSPNLAWHSLFIRAIADPARKFRSSRATSPTSPSSTCRPSRPTRPRHGTRTDTIVAIDFTRKIVLIGNSSYAGEMKKSVFTTLNFYLPAQGVMPMHCSANVGKDDDVALFFGLSGTGKTTLSADPNRTLIGDDEHGWSPRRRLQFRGRLLRQVHQALGRSRAEIYAATNRFGAVLENVEFDPDTRVCDFDSDRKTENTRSAYPIEFMPLASRTGRAGQPKNIIFLTADAFGVMPPIAKLTPAQAMYHFLSGYTAKVAGHRKGSGRRRARILDLLCGAVPAASAG